MCVCHYVCGKRKPVTYIVGLLFASQVFYTTFEMTLKLIIHIIWNLVCNETLVITKLSSEPLTLLQPRSTVMAMWITLNWLPVAYML